MRRILSIILCVCAGACVNSYRVSDVSMGKFRENYRLMISTNAPEASVRQESGDLLAVVLPPDTRISGTVAKQLKNFNHPCRFEGTKRASDLLLLFSCGADIKIYPEVYRGKVDIIFTDLRNVMYEK
jgi:hypothetical protein